MESRQGEFGPLLFHSIRPAYGVDAQATFDHQSLASLGAVLQVLGQISPADHLDLARRILRPQAVKAHGHFRYGRLVVLGVTHLWGLQHLHLKQTVIHSDAYGLLSPS
jgi:hypothetical protein